jgi:hypothetical protein
VRRASSHIDHPQPISSIETANGIGEVANTQPTSEATSSAVPTTIALRSPSRATRAPAGRSKSMAPTPRRATVRLATATEAPTSRAASATIGMTAPWPMLNTNDGP